MSTSRNNRNPSPAGKRLLEAIDRKYGHEANGVSKLAYQLSDEPNTANYDTIITTLSAMINGNNLSKWNRKLFLPMERILGIRIADIIDGTKEYKQSPRGLFEIGTEGSYEDFEWLASQTDGSVEVIRSFDEWSKGIVDYVFEAKNIEGFKYLAEHGFFDSFAPGSITAYGYHSSNSEETLLAVLDLLSLDNDPKHELFDKVVDPKEHSDLAAIRSEEHFSESAIRMILQHENLLNAVCREPSAIPESKLSGSIRAIDGDQEYMALCASHWLTPCLNYAIEHEDKYALQAKRLLEYSYDVASQTLSHIKENLILLGGHEASVTTKNGYVLLGHSHVIGIIGEPVSDGVIQNEELRRLANEVTAKIGSFRALSKLQTPILINGKMHMPHCDQNPLYSRFVFATKDKPYLLHLSENKDGDSNNYVFDAPSGKEARNGLTLDQWKQVGCALRSIHSIDAGEEGKAYCHGRFYYQDIYIQPNEEVELITGYQNVYIGDPIDDLYAMGLLAFEADYFSPRKQNQIQAFLEGYGHPYDGFLKELANHLFDLAKAEKSANEIRFLMNSAAEVLNAASQE